jgi:hypothetical protein
VVEVLLSVNVHRVSDIRQREVHTAELLVPDQSTFQVEIAIAKLTRYISPSSDEIPTEMIQAGSKTLRSEIHKPIHSIWKKEELSDHWKEFILAVTRVAILIIVEYRCYKLLTKIYPIFFFQD